MLAKYSSFPKAELFINHQNSSNKIDLGGIFLKKKKKKPARHFCKKKHLSLLIKLKKLPYFF